MTIDDKELIKPLVDKIIAMETSLNGLLDIASQSIKVDEFDKLDKDPFDLQHWFDNL